jgi:hypothetical protein
MDVNDKYSLVGDHDKHFELHDSSDDKKFLVPKKDLHPATQIKIMKMKKFYAGGIEASGDSGEDGVDEGVTAPSPEIQGVPVRDVPPDDPAASAPQAPLADTPAPQMATQPQAVAPQQTMPETPQGPVTASPSVMTPDQAGYPTAKELKSSIDTQKNAVQFEASAQQMQNTKLAEQMQKNQQAEQIYMEAQNKRLSDYQNHYDEMVRQFASEKLDPKRFINNMTTGQKITSSIGLLLSGLGSGLTGQPNVALQMLNRDIENDIDSQKENLGNKKTLLGENLRAQGNLMAAVNMTRLQMSAAAQGKLQLIAAQTGNPIIAARAQAASAAITQNSMAARAQLASHDVQMQIRQDVANRLKSQGTGGAPNVDLFDLERAGLIDHATAEKESAAISKRQQAEAYATDQIKKLDQEQTVMGGTLANGLPNIINPESYNRRDQLRAGIIQAIQSASPSKRLTPEMIAMQVEPFLTKTLETGKTRQAGLDGIIGLIRSHADPTPMATHYKLPGAIHGGNVTRKSFEMGKVK